MNDNHKSILPLRSNEVLHDFVKTFFVRKQVFIDIVKQFGSPLYILEPAVLKDRANQFRNAFTKSLDNTSFYYAMKSNNLPYISGILLEQGFGLDVSSGLELEIALNLNAKDIIFSGPGKTDKELELAADNCDRVVILLDSQGECQRLKAIVNHKKRLMNVGVRLNNNPTGLWRKFGVMPEYLPLMFDDIFRHPFLNFKGLQFHSSWNMDPDRQVDFLHTLGDLIQKCLKFFANHVNLLILAAAIGPLRGNGWCLIRNTCIT